MYVCMYVCVYVCMYVTACVRACVRAYVKCVCVCVCVCVHCVYTRALCNLLFMCTCSILPGFMNFSMNSSLLGLWILGMVQWVPWTGQSSSKLTFRRNSSKSSLLAWKRRSCSSRLSSLPSVHKTPIEKKGKKHGNVAKNEKKKWLNDYSAAGRIAGKKLTIIPFISPPV